LAKAELCKLYVPVLKTKCVPNSKVRTCAGKATSSVLWDSAGVLFMQFLNRGATVTVERHVPILQQLIATNSKGSTKQEDESRPDPA